jgi:hypothetical protein
LCLKKKQFNVKKKNWPRKYSNANDDPYETLILAYNKHTYQPVETNTISSEVEEGDFETCLDGEMMKSNDEEESMVPKTPCPKEL